MRSILIFLSGVTDVGIVILGLVRMYADAVNRNNLYIQEVSRVISIAGRNPTVVVDVIITTMNRLIQIKTQRLDVTALNGTY